MINYLEQEVLLELKKSNKLLAMLVTQGRTQGEKIILLNQIGLSPKEISEILGITANQVSVTLHQNKKKPKKT